MLTSTQLLIVEDDKALADLLLVHLRKLHCDVWVAETGEEAIIICEQAGSPPDVVIMDIKLPGMDGVSCARQLRHKYPDISIIFLTGHVEESVLQRARIVTPSAFILKDVGNPSAESLRAMIILALDQRERDRSSAQLEVRVRKLDLFDYLTKLYNRSGFDMLATRYLKPGKQAVLFIDLDNLTAINSEHGHDVGDEALRHFATILQGVFRPDDLVARLSSDEFAVLATIEDDSLVSIKQKVHQALTLANLSGNLGYDLEASVGAVMAEPGKDIESLLAKADESMLEEKRRRQSRIPTKRPK
jgi:diguanylate cyclase (GGDEF)-like protein